MTLSSEELKKLVVAYVKKDSPEFADVEPSVQKEERSVPQTAERKLGLSHPQKIPSKVTVFTFKKVAIAEDGAKIPVVSRVTVDENGNILKVTGN